MHVMADWMLLMGVTRTKVTGVVSDEEQVIHDVSHETGD